MKNETLIEFVKEKYYEQKMSVEYELQLTKIIKLEKKSPKIFQKINGMNTLTLTLQ